MGTPRATKRHSSSPSSERPLDFLPSTHTSFASSPHTKLPCTDQKKRKPPLKQNLRRRAARKHPRRSKTRLKPWETARRPQLNEHDPCQKVDETQASEIMRFRI